MSFTQLVKNSLLHINKLKEAKTINFSKITLFVVLLSFIMTLPLSYQVISVFHDIQKDGQTIAQKIPDFTITDGQIQTENTEGFIYQTDSIIFTFDPEGKRTAKEVSDDMIGNLFSVGLLRDELVISLPANEITTALMGGSQFTFSYDEEQLSGLSGSSVRDFLTNTQFPAWMYLIVLLVTFYPSFLNLLLTLFTTALIANIYSHFKRVSYRFFDNLKVTIACASWPVLIASLISLFFFNFDSFTFIIISTFFIYTIAIKEAPQVKL